ncbi:MAG: hypothetical protein ACRCVV_19880 [Shewanella sp.]
MVNLGFTEQEKAILKPFASGHPHVFLNKEDGICLEVEAWVKANRPHVLIVVARNANYTGVMDTGYGKMFLLDTNTGESVQALNHIALLNNAVFLDKKYYGTNSYIFISDDLEEYTKELGDALDYIQDGKLDAADCLLKQLSAVLSPNNTDLMKAKLLLRKEQHRANLHANNDEYGAGLATD